MLETRTLPDATLAPITGYNCPTALYLQGLYSQLLQREAQPAEINSWLIPVGYGMARSQAVAAILNSPEYETNLIQSSYQTLLGRAPDPAGAQALFQFLQAGGSQEQLTVAFLASHEFYVDQGNTPSGWLTALYKDVLARAPGASELASGVQMLAGGVTEQALAAALVTSTEADTRFVQATYQQYLNRQPATADVSGWVGQMQQGMGRAQVLTQVASSDEFYQNQLDFAQLTANLPSVGTLSVVEGNGTASGTLTDTNNQVVTLTGSAWYPRPNEVDMALTESTGGFLYLAALSNGAVYVFPNGQSAKTAPGNVLLHPKETAALTATLGGWSISLADTNGVTSGTLQQAGQPTLNFSGISAYLPEIGKTADGGSSDILGTDFTLRTIATITNGNWAGRTLLLTASTDGTVSLQVFSPAGLSLQGAATVGITGSNGVATTASVEGTIGGWTISVSEPNNASTDGGAWQNWTTGTLQQSGGPPVQFQGNNLFLPNPWPLLAAPTELVSQGTITTGPWSGSPYLLDASSVTGTVAMQVFSGVLLSLQGTGSVAINL
jgi:hypothetical protein